MAATHSSDLSHQEWLGGGEPASAQVDRMLRQQRNKVTQVAFISPLSGAVCSSQTPW